jgi:predicted hydrocarbon binding protein
MRMCLVDVETSFFSLRKSMEGIVGAAAAILFYDSGLRGGTHYAEARLKQGSLEANEAGFRLVIEGYSEGGFGAYEIRELAFAKGEAVIVCKDPMAFEAYAVVANGERRSQPVCDFSRGVLAGLLSGLTKRNNLGGFEETCRATGAAECIFRIGEEETMRRASVTRNLASSAARTRG